MKDDALVVLLVEDNPAHAEIVIRLLEDHHIVHRIYHFADGEAALAYLFRRGTYSDKQRYPFPQLVLLDLRLPKIDGLEVLKQIKSSEALCMLPVVVLSSSEAEADIAAAYRRHANSYLVKPMDHEKFTVLIESVGLYWLNLNRRPVLPERWPSGEEPTN